MRDFLYDESGASAVEYGLIVATISIAIFAAVGSMSDQLKAVFKTLATDLAAQ